MKAVFLMAGKDSGDAYPLYLTEIQGGLILEQQVRRIEGLDCEQIIFCVSAKDIKKYKIDFIIGQLTDAGKCVRINGETGGAACTALLAGEYLDNNDEILLLAIDDFIDEPLADIINYFRKSGCAAGIVSFKSVHPRYSFARTSDEGVVLETSEKQPVSNKALASFYYFSDGREFLEAAKNVIRKDRKVDDKFYISQVVNEIILRQRTVSIYEIPNSKYHPLKTEMQLAQYITEYNALKESK
jgi:dTDP-glucose pyrophosphorylase